ncbi:hypothetical protein Q3G72_015302 [Acer saccharum]|nr:hypothetical protein Q3G72_015302 [Acer saccharum]
MDVSLFETTISGYNKIMLHDHQEIARNDDIKRLYTAALLGNAGELTQLLNENIDLLEDVLLTRADTPLHIAARLGHLNFVRTILIHKPSLAWELDQNGFTAMNLASENGHITIVKELLACDPLLYKLKDRDGKTLLHCAAIHGRLEILHELLTNFVDCVGQVTARGETALHLALKNNQEEAFSMLMDWIKQTHNQRLLYWKDKSGNTVLNLVRSKNMYEKKLQMQQTQTKKYSGTHDHQEQQKHKMLTAATLIMSLAIFLLGSSWTQQTCQLDKKHLRLDQEYSMLFHLQVMFNLFGVVSAAYVIILVLTTGLENGRRKRYLLLLMVSAYSTIISYACAIANMVIILQKKRDFYWCDFLRCLTSYATHNLII